jgi:hypothetical protein
MKWLIGLVLDWGLSKILTFIKNLIYQFKKKKEDEKEVDQVIENLEKAETEEERRAANRDIIKPL